MQPSPRLCTLILDLLDWPRSPESVDASQVDRPVLSVFESGMNDGVTDPESSRCCMRSARIKSQSQAPARMAWMRDLHDLHASGVRIPVQFSRRKMLRPRRAAARERTLSRSGRRAFGKTLPTCRKSNRDTLRGGSRAVSTTLRPPGVAADLPDQAAGLSPEVAFRPWNGSWKGAFPASPAANAKLLPARSLLIQVDAGDASPATEVRSFRIQSPARCRKFPETRGCTCLRTARRP